MFIFAALEFWRQVLQRCHRIQKRLQNH